MSHTKDNNKKAKDNNAINMKRNELVNKNFKAGKHQDSKSMNHL
ncbi:hypothetical protein [Bacillus massiliigorillae]|nr:hypothetical protein [Bacillus massiliigorillae]